MGPGGHFCRCKRCIANTNAYGYGYGYAATDANTEAGAIRKAAPNASAQAIDIPGRISSADN
jgi:hypothetical protein